MGLFSDDGTLSKSSSISRFYALINEAADKLGQDFRHASKLDPFIQAAGFVGIHHEAMKLPLGTWPVEKKQKEIGAYFMLCTEDGFEAYGIGLLTKVQGLPLDEANELIKNATKESHSRHIHSYSVQ